MMENKCNECGAIIPEGKNVCPNCGCPIESTSAVVSENTDKTPLEMNVEGIPVSSMPATSSVASEATVHTEAVTASQSSKLNLRALIAMVIGVIILIMGVTVVKHDVAVATYSASNYSTSDYAFGADFYTEMYETTDTIVDELSDINGGIETVTKSVKGIAETINYAAGMIIIAVGLGVIAISVLKLKKES